MLPNSRKRKNFSPLNLTSHSIKLAKIETLDLEVNRESTSSQGSKNSIQSKIKTFSECSPATLNYLKHNWSSDDKENNIAYCSRNISNGSGYTNDKVPEKKIKYIPDCSPMTQSMIANCAVECFESQEVDLVTCSEDSEFTPPKLNVETDTQFSGLSNDSDEGLEYFGQKKNNDIQLYFDSNLVKICTSPFKSVCSVPSDLSDKNIDKEILLLSGISPLSFSQQSNFEDNKIHCEKCLLREQNESELKKTQYLLSDVCCEYAEHDSKISCAPTMKSHNNINNNLPIMNIDELQQVIRQNIQFLEMNFV